MCVGRSGTTTKQRWEWKREGSRAQRCFLSCRKNVSAPNIGNLNVRAGVALRGVHLLQSKHVFLRQCWLASVPAASTRGQEVAAHAVTPSVPRPASVPPPPVSMHRDTAGTWLSSQRLPALAGFKGEGWKPFIGVGYGFNANNTSAQLVGGGIDFRFRAPVLPNRLKLEVGSSSSQPTLREAVFVVTQSVMSIMAASLSLCLPARAQRNPLGRVVFCSGPMHSRLRCRCVEMPSFRSRQRSLKPMTMAAPSCLARVASLCTWHN